MLKTGIMDIGQIADSAHGLMLPAILRTSAGRGSRKWLCGGIAACVFMLWLLAPVSIDVITGEISANAALAGQGDGNYGNGKGNGGPNRQVPGKRGGHGDDEGDDEAETPPANPVTGDGGGHDAGADAAADMADIDFAEAVDLVADGPAEGPMAGTPVTALPTIGQIFAMGNEASVSAQEELKLIANGWGGAK